MSSVLELTSTNLDRKDDSIPAPMKSLERYRFPPGHTISDHRNPRRAQAAIEVTRIHADHLVAGITKALTRLAVDVENGLVLVQEEETIRRVINKAAKSGLTRTQLILCPLPLRDIAHQA